MSDESAPQPDHAPFQGTPAGVGPVPEHGIAPEVSRRVSSILDAVEREAARLREDAREESRRYLDYSRRRADSLLAERQRRIAELSDEIMIKAEAVVGRLDDAAPVRQGFENLVRALGDAAERLAREAGLRSSEFDPPPFHDEAPIAPDPQPAPYPEYYAPAPPPQPAYDQPGEAEPPAPIEFAAPAFDRQPHPARAPAPYSGAPEPAFAAAHDPVPEPSPPPDDAMVVAIQMAAGGRSRQEVREHLQAALGLLESSPILDQVFGPGSAEDARVPWTAFPH